MKQSLPPPAVHYLDDEGLWVASGVPWPVLEYSQHYPNMLVAGYDYSKVPSSRHATESEAVEAYVKKPKPTISLQDLYVVISEHTRLSNHPHQRPTDGNPDAEANE